MEERDLPPEYRPISAWGYFGYTILFSIPVIGIIMLIVFACGGTQNVNLKNYARSFFCIYVVALVLFVILLATGLGAAIFDGVDSSINSSVMHAPNSI